ncbi:MAG TPA: type ISP restriction/modification enzyme, partial [Allosphingosinicella sp.]|nr:type ISP restriction/modification enzyme [Allosphingosinicella sp.]
ANQPAILEDWIPPPDWGVGAHAKHLRNLYVYFWRWAAWKVFERGSGAPEETLSGMVCFITVAGFLNGPGFQKMRAELRRECDEIWVIDCSPEGHQPAVSTRIFQGVQHPVCIVLASRSAVVNVAKPARVQFRSLERGPREGKFAELTSIGLAEGWTNCPSEWRAPFLPEFSGQWRDFVSLDDLFEYSCPGVMPGRVWVVAPDQWSLKRRWHDLVTAQEPEWKEKLFHPQLRSGQVASRHIRKFVNEHLGAHRTRELAIISDSGPLAPLVRYGFRSFDRQWLPADARLINDPRPRLWASHSDRQIFITALMAHSPSNGPAITFTALIPDQHHYKGSFGGRVFSLWADAAATKPNLPDGLLGRLRRLYGSDVSAEDLMAYVAAVAAHPAYTARFQADLIRPGLRIPLTAEANLFFEAAELGREVIWLHTFGERFVDPAEGRPVGPPRMANGPTIPKDGAIPSDAARMPDEIDYDAAARRLKVGAGFVDNVPPGAWAYEVSGKQVLRQWFSYRKRNRERPIIGDRRKPSPLGDIQPDHWLPEYTTELLNVLHVLGRLVELEPKQANLLDRICTGPTIPAAKL